MGKYNMRSYGSVAEREPSQERSFRRVESKRGGRDYSVGDVARARRLEVRGSKSMPTWRESPSVWRLESFDPYLLPDGTIDTDRRCTGTPAYCVPGSAARSRIASAAGSGRIKQIENVKRAHLNRIHEFVAYYAPQYSAGQTYGAGDFNLLSIQDRPFPIRTTSWRMAASVAARRLTAPAQCTDKATGEAYKCGRTRLSEEDMVAGGVFIGLYRQSLAGDKWQAAVYLVRYSAAPDAEGKFALTALNGRVKPTIAGRDTSLDFVSLDDLATNYFAEVVTQYRAGELRGLITSNRQKADQLLAMKEAKQARR